jgi:hypothetical protein
LYRYGTGMVALAAQKTLDKLTGVDLIDEASERWKAENGGDEKAVVADEDKPKAYPKPKKWEDI